MCPPNSISEGYQSSTLTEPPEIGFYQSFTRAIIKSHDWVEVSVQNAVRERYRNCLTLPGSRSMRSNPIRFPASETLWNERHRKESVTSKSHLPREGIERWQHKGTALLTLGREPVVRMPGVRAPISRARRALRPPCHRSHVVAGAFLLHGGRPPSVFAGRLFVASRVCVRARDSRVSQR